MSLYKRVENLEAAESLPAILVTSDPNGVKDYVASTIGIDITNKKIYICFGNKVWKEILTA